jgi:glycosyltransferase involved in cell wall biosynthesis
MPVLEAGLAGLAIFCTPAAPAGPELAGDEAVFFAADDPPEAVAGCILDWAQRDQAYALRRRVRREYTWKAIFERDIRPLLEANCPG